MLQLKSFTVDRDRPMVHLFTGSHLLLSLRLQVFHPTTRTHARLLGPCFQTGPMAAFTLQQSSLGHAPRNVGKPTKTRFFLRGSIIPEAPAGVVHQSLPRIPHTSLAVAWGGGWQVLAETPTVRVTADIGYPCPLQF